MTWDFVQKEAGKELIAKDDKYRRRDSRQPERWVKSTWTLKHAGEARVTGERWQGGSWRI
jgi:hypothetical protein